VQKEKQVLSERLSGHWSARTRTPQETYVNFSRKGKRKQNEKQISSKSRIACAPAYTRKI